MKDPEMLQFENKKSYISLFISCTVDSPQIQQTLFTF